MRTQTEHVLQKLFSETSIDHISVDRLKQLVDEHPYFTLGHLLLAKKLQTITAAEYEAQSEKASLYFNEPIWLQSLLQPMDEIDFASREKAEPRDKREETQPLESFHAEESTTVEQVEIDSPGPQPDPISQLTSYKNEEAQEAQIETADQYAGEEQPSMETVQQPTPENIVTTIEETVETGKEEAPQVFEPYHTIDYFASQGIRVSTDIKPDDRLAHQLRSFTEWLKTMKRLPETKVEQQLDEVTQQNIQEFAAHSLDEKEVVTETMAEVLMKQNRDAEAVAMYEKLSLLNPSKRAYFAAKIEQLKGS